MNQSLRGAKASKLAEAKHSRSSPWGNGGSALLCSFSWHVSLSNRSRARRNEESRKTTSNLPYSLSPRVTSGYFAKVWRSLEALMLPSIKWFFPASNSLSFIQVFVLEESVTRSYQHDSSWPNVRRIRYEICISITHPAYLAICLEIFMFFILLIAEAFEEFQVTVFLICEKWRGKF